MSQAPFEPAPPIPAETIPALLSWAAETFSNAPYLAEADGRRLSFRETRALAERAARGFIAAGVEAGDRVAVWAPNGSEWVIATLGLHLAGAVLVPINTRFRGTEAAYILGKARVAVLCTVDGFLNADYIEMLRAAAGGPGQGRPVEGLPDLKSIVLLDDKTHDGAVPFSALLVAGDTVAPETLTARSTAVRGDSVADILFTSGTTGNPKGAMHSHRQAVQSSATMNFVNDLRAGDRMLIVNPFFHSFGYRAGWMACLCAGATAYPLAVFDTDAVLGAIQDQKINTLPGPPTLFLSVLDHPKRGDYDLTSLRAGTTGSANMPFELVRRAYEDLGFEIFLTSYGLTEATAFATSCRIGDDFQTIAGTCGRPFPGVEIRIIDADGAEAVEGEAGEIMLRGDNVMLGYFEDPEATARTVESDGWLHTGDVGKLDARGYLRVVDRLKDIVIVGGFNAYPAEIEAALSEHPAIAEVAVLGAPDARMGEVPAAVVVLRPGAELTLSQLTAWSRQRLANFKVPRVLVTIDALPKTPLGKVQKFLLRELVAEAAKADS